MKKRPKVGLALGSGSARGLVHIGVIKTLKENDIPIDYIAGTSIGALISAYYALYSEINKLEDIALKLTKNDLIKLIDLNSPKKALIKGIKIKKFFSEIIDDKSFSDIKIPLTIITTDLESGEEVKINNGKLIDAIQASISLPGIFSPIKLHGKLLVDGGVINPTPINVVKEMGADIIIGVDLTIRKKVELENPNIVETLLQSFEIIRTQATKFNINKINKNVILIQPYVKKRINSIKFYEAKKFIEQGKFCTLNEIPKIKMLIKQLEK